MRAGRLSVHAHRLVAGRRVGDGGKRPVDRGRGRRAGRGACLPAIAASPPTSWPASRRRLNGAMPRRRRGRGSWPSALSLPLADAVASHAEALSAGDGEGLLAASAAYRGIGDRVAAADAAAQARWRSTKASTIAAGCTPRRWPGNWPTNAVACTRRRCALRRGLKLSGRQRDVVELVVAGLSNREIAETAGDVGAHRGGPRVPGLSAGGCAVARGVGVDHPIGPLRPARALETQRPR